MKCPQCQKDTKEVKKQYVCQNITCPLEGMELDAETVGAAAYLTTFNKGIFS